jgi:hypothetical protein
MAEAKKTTEPAKRAEAPVRADDKAMNPADPDSILAPRDKAAKGDKRSLNERTTGYADKVRELVHDTRGRLAELRDEYVDMVQNVVPEPHEEGLGRMAGRVDTAFDDVHRALDAVTAMAADLAQYPVNPPL